MRPLCRKSYQSPSEKFFNDMWVPKTLGDHPRGGARGGSICNQPIVLGHADWIQVVHRASTRPMRGLALPLRAENRFPHARQPSAHSRRPSHRTRVARDVSSDLRVYDGCCLTRRERHQPINPPGGDNKVRAARCAEHTDRRYNGRPAPFLKHAMAIRYEQGNTMTTATGAEQPRELEVSGVIDDAGHHRRGNAVDRLVVVSHVCAASRSSSNDVVSKI